MTNARQSGDASKADTVGNTGNSGEVRRLSDKRNDGILPSVSIEGFIGQDITVKSFETLDSQFGEGEKYAIIVADTAMGTDVRIRTGSQVLLRKLAENESFMPYIATVKRAGRALTLE